MKRALGIDLSEWDLKPLDWHKASELVSFAFIKISQGTNPDPLFRGQWNAAEGYTLRGIYHMLDPHDAIEESVDRTIDIYKTVTPGELPPALDLELGVAKTELPRARAWLERWEAKTGKRPIIYTSLGFLGQERFTEANRWLGKYSLWLASWPYDDMSEDPRRDRIRQVLRGEILIPYPSPPTPWVIAPDFFQWTSRGEPGDIPGYYTGIYHKKAVDLNYYHGTREDLFLRYGEPKKLSGNGVEVPSPYKYSITPTSSDGSKIRNDHYRIDAPLPNRIGSLAFGRSAFGNDIWVAPDDGNPLYKAGDTWLRVTMVDGVPMDGWIAAIHQGVRYAHIIPIETEGGETPSPEDPALSVSLAVEADVTSEGVEVDITVSSSGYASRSVKVTLPREL